MKKLITKKAFMLLFAFFMASALFGQTTKRYVFVLGGYPSDSPLWHLIGWIIGLMM